MKTTIKSFVALFACLAVIACGEKKKEETAKKEKYCGVELTGFQVIDLKAIANRGFNASEDDQVLIKKIVNDVNALFDSKYEIGMAFFMKDDNKVGMYIMGPDDPAVTEKVMCYLLGTNMDNVLPKERNLLYYTGNHNNIVAGIKSK